MDKYLQSSSTLFGSLKNAVLGNPVTREYQVEKQIASFGPGLIWRVFEGRKKSTGQEASLFVLEKKLLDNFSKQEREQILEVMRRGPVQLTKLKHPRVLTVQHPLEESRDSLAFATEPVFASLSNVLGRHNNMPSPVPSEVREYDLYDVEKVYGLLQVAEGLAFLHFDVKLIEGNLTPDNIVITRRGQWKLAGFHFSSRCQESIPQFSWDSSQPLLAKPDLNYLAPEYVISESKEVNSDMYTFGCLLTAVYSKLRSPFDAGNSLTSYKRCIEQLSRFGSDWLRNVPHEVRDHVLLLLNIAPGVRPDANQTLKHPFFDDVAAMTLKYLDSLVQRDSMTKSQFFKNLHRVLSKLPKRVIHQRVLPHLFMEFPNHPMIPFVLPNVLLIADDSTDEEYNSVIFPELKKIFPVKEPIQVLLIFMQKMELLLKKTRSDDVKNYVLPLVFRALESSAPQIQELVLSIIPNFASMIDYSSMKNAIIPRIKTIICKTNSLPVRVNALVCIGKIVEYLDKFLMMDDIFPALTQVPSREPAVLMGILGIYKQTLANKKTTLEKDYLATKAIPFLLPLAVDPGLNTTQFNNFMAIIRDMMDRVEQEHRTKLEQLSKMKQEQESALQFVKAVDQSHSLKEMMTKVDKLVIGSPEKVSESFGGNSEFAKIFGTSEGIKSEAPKQDLMSRSESELTAMSSQQMERKQETRANCLQSTAVEPMPWDSKSTQLHPEQPRYLPMATSSTNVGILLPSKAGSGLTPHGSASAISSAVDSLMTKNVNVMGTPKYGTSMGLTDNATSTGMYAHAHFDPLSAKPVPPPSDFSGILTPEMKKFRSNQQTMSLGQMQKQQQQQQQQYLGGTERLQQQQSLLSNAPMNGSIMQSQTQSITMYQTQTQHVFPMMSTGIVPQAPSHVQQRHAGILAPHKIQSGSGTFPQPQNQSSGNMTDLSDLLS